MCAAAQVHRLDVGTGGLMMVGKTRAATNRLCMDLAEHNMQKRCVWTTSLMCLA